MKQARPHRRRNTRPRPTEELVLAAKTSKVWRCRQSAAKRLTSREALADLARTARNDAVRREAVANPYLEDVSILTEVAKNDDSWAVRLAAVARLKDQTVLAEIARTDRSAAVRLVAIQALTDEHALAQMARTDPDRTIRTAASLRCAEIANVSRRRVRDIEMSTSPEPMTPPEVMAMVEPAIPKDDTWACGSSR